jgi:hypothetical protein
MSPRTIALFACTALCSISAPSQAVEISGPWKIDSQNGPSPICGFEQAGNNLTGSCIGPNAKGTITGTIVGDQVRWRWQWVAYTANSSAAFDFIGTLTPNNTITGWVFRRGTNLSLNFTAKRHQPSQPAADLAKPTGPPVDPDQQLMDTVERRANKLFPWAGQEDERRKYIIDEMNAAANRRQGNSYSIHVTR